MIGASSPSSPNWDAYRYLLSVGRLGSIAGAAKELGESQPTVGRRIKDLETALGTQLFMRKTTGVELTDCGRRVYAHAEKVERELASAGEAIAGGDERLEGSVIVAAPEAFAHHALTPRLGAFRERYPEIDLELKVGVAKINLVNREADVALRIGDPVQESLVGKNVGTLKFSLFASTEYIARRGEPRTVAALDGHDLVDATRDLGFLSQSVRLHAFAGDARRVFRANSVSAQIAAVAGGVGVGALPCYVGRHNPDMVEILPDKFFTEEEVWVLTHRDLRAVARVRAVMAFLSEVAKAAIEA